MDSLIPKVSNSLSIEMCDTKKDGTIKATEATMANTAELCKKLMKKYNIKADHVIRHFDVNGKHCPAYFMNSNAWSKFKDRLTETKPKKKTGFKVKVEIPDLNIRKGPGTKYAKIGKFTGKGTFTIVETSAGAGSKTGWGRLSSGLGWISLDYAKKI